MIAEYEREGEAKWGRGEKIYLEKYVKNLVHL